jgi:hypothetical protein
MPVSPKPSQALGILDGRARLNLVPTDKFFHDGFDPLPIDGHGNIGDGEDIFGHVSR